MNHGKELLWQGKNISVYNTLTKKKVPKSKEKHDLLPVFEMFSCLRVDSISQEGRETELGGRLFPQGPQCWPRASMGQKSCFGEEKRKQETGREDRREGKVWTQGHPEASGTHHTVKTVVSVLPSLQKSAAQSSKGQCVIIWGLAWFLSCLF